MGISMYSRGGVELAVDKAFRELLLAVQVLGLRLTVLASEFLLGLLLGLTVVYGHTNNRQNKQYN